MPPNLPPPDSLPPDWPPSDQLPPDQPPPSTPPILINHGLQVYLPNTHNYGFQVNLWVHSISASLFISTLAQSRLPSASLSSLDLSVSKCISKLARSRPPSISLSTLDFDLHVQVQTRLIPASECISKLAPLGSPCLHDHDLQVHLQTHSITASKYIFKECRWLYRDTRGLEVDRAMGSIYSADRGVDRHHLISISSYHTMRMHTLSYPTFGLTRPFQHFVDAQRLVVSYLLTQFLCSSNQNLSYELRLDVARGAAECWWWALCLLAPLFHHNGPQVVHL